jgi:sensor histidine kinase YesM
MEKQKTFFHILIHFFIWGFAFCIPVIVLWRHEGIDTFSVFQQNAITLAASAILFYTNYTQLVDKQLSKRKYFRFIFSNILLILVLAVVVVAIKVACFGLENGPQFTHPMASRLRFMFVRELFSLLFIYALSIIIKLLSSLFISQSEKKEEEKRRKEAELINLRQQINPHFFFNTLNNIYALIEISPEKAQNTVLELSKLMRYVLYENDNNLVPVCKELDFIKNYIELMRIRLTDNVDLRVDIRVSPTIDREIAPMIFISLIENAFKHGVSHSRPSFIHIDFHQVADRIVCVVRNSYFPKNGSDRSGSGIGLENLSRRLDILYPHKHILKCGQEGDVYVSELIVPLYDKKH